MVPSAHPELVDLRLAVGVEREVARSARDELDGGVAQQRNPWRLVNRATVGASPEGLCRCGVGDLERPGPRDEAVQPGVAVAAGVRGPCRVLGVVARAG